MSDRDAATAGQAAENATARPWQADPDGEIIGPAPYDGASIAMVLLNERGAANADLIVRAVNSFDGLVAALRSVVFAWEGGQLGTVHEMQRAIPYAREVLARAEGR